MKIKLEIETNPIPNDLKPVVLARLLRVIARNLDIDARLAAKVAIDIKCDGREVRATYGMSELVKLGDIEGIAGNIKLKDKAS